MPRRARAERPAKQARARRGAASERSSARRKPGPAAGSGWLVYMLRCRDGSLYTGITNDLRRRLAAHAAGTASKYTRSRLPVTLVYREPQDGRSPALKREAAIKRLARPRKERLIATAGPARGPHEPACLKAGGRSVV
ncbi:MAG: damage endonuclease [Planctomycetota bacterium]|jgi:putative endonuclease